MTSEWSRWKTGLDNTCRNVQEYFWGEATPDSSQGLLLAQLSVVTPEGDGGHYGVLNVKPKLTACKASILPAVLSLQPAKQYKTYSTVLISVLFNKRKLFPPNDVNSLTDEWIDRMKSLILFGISCLGNKWNSSENKWNIGIVFIKKLRL